MGNATPETVASKFAAGVLLNEIEAATWLGVALATVRNWRSRHGGPAFLRLGKRCVRYRPRDLEAFAKGEPAESEATA